MADLRGTPVIYNAKNITITSVVTASDGKNLSMDFAREADFNAFNDDEGDILAEVTTNIRKTISLRVVPFDATNRAGAVTNMYAMLPEPGSQAVVVDAETSGNIDDLHSGNYSVRSARLGRTSEGIATVDLELLQYKKVDISGAAIT